MESWLKLIISLVLVQLVGITSSFSTRSSVSTWYVELVKPSFNPPGWVFGPVWTILYLMIGISLFLVWNKKKSLKTRKKAYWIFAIQLVLNWLWSIVFFGMQSPGLALLVIFSLWIFIILNLVFFYKISKTAGWLLVPYWFWVSFASVLNLAIWWLN